MAKGREWTQNDLFFLEENYSKLSVQQIANHLDRSKHSIYQKAKEFKLKFRESKSNIKYEKVLISLTPTQNEYLERFNNKSEVVRKALSYLMLRENRRKSFKFNIDKIHVKRMNEINKLIELSGYSSQDELAKKLNTKSSRISEYKTGKRGITLQRLKDWCQILGIDIKLLFD